MQIKYYSGFQVISILHEIGGDKLLETIERFAKEPSADVVEVKKASNISKDGFLCSNCSFGDFGGFHGYEPNYCPNCGASMERGEKDVD